MCIGREGIASTRPYLHAGKRRFLIGLAGHAHRVHNLICCSGEGTRAPKYEYVRKKILRLPSNNIIYTHTVDRIIYAILPIGLLPRPVSLFSLYPRNAVRYPFENPIFLSLESTCIVRTHIIYTRHCVRVRRVFTAARAVVRVTTGRPLTGWSGVPGTTMVEIVPRHFFSF